MLGGLAADADLQRLRDANGNGVVDPGEVLATSARGGSSPELIVRTLAAGPYFVRVHRFSADTSDSRTLAL